jgi:hypothetical protein
LGGTAKFWRSHHTQVNAANHTPIELLYSRLVANEKIKSGSALERIAALVFFELEQDATVTHQVRLRGSGETYHWIDVVVTRGGETRRTLIECKDYDKQVGLEEALVFGGRLAQFPYDDAFMITTVGFTRPALTYLADQEVIPVVLRPISTDDHIVKKIVFTIDGHFDDNVRVDLMITDPDEAALLEPSVGARTMLEAGNLYAVNGEFIESLAEAITRTMMMPIADSKPGPYTRDITFDEPYLLEMDSRRARLDGFVVSWDHFVATHSFSVETKAIPALVLANAQGGIERVFSESEILELSFADDGKTVIRRVPA